LTLTDLDQETYAFSIALIGAPSPYRRARALGSLFLTQKPHG
jgi:hypothetical protein